MTNPITPEAVERFNLMHGVMTRPDMGGDWVRASDYDALARELAEVRAERDAKARTLAVQVLITDKEQARAEKAETALTTARAQIVAAQEDMRERCIVAARRYLYRKDDSIERAIRALPLTDPADAP